VKLAVMPRQAVVLCTALAIATALVSACSSDPGSTSSPPTTPAGDRTSLGAISASLNVAAGGLALVSVTWTITNGSGYTATGMVGIGDAQAIQFVVGGIPGGSGYTIAVAGTDSGGDACAGSATFAIAPGETAPVTLSVTCTVPTDASLGPDVTNGFLEVEASVIRVPLAEGPACPGIMALSISPAQQRIGSTSALTLTTVGPTPAVSWSQSGVGTGTFGDASAAATTFECLTAGVVSIAATVGLPDSGACTGVAFTTAVATVDCEPRCSTASDCPASTTACATPVCIANVCGSSDAPVGTACTDSGGQICNGGGACGVPAFDVVRVGDGFDALGSSASPVFIDQYNLAGALVGSPIALPTTAGGTNQVLTLTGTTVSEGDLTTSADGRSLAMAGYAAATGSSVTSVNRVAAHVNAAGTIDTSTVLTNAFAGGIVRSAVSLDGAEFWVSGTATDTSGGIWYTPSDLQLVQIPNGAQSVGARWLRLASGQLYGDSDQNPPDLFAVGSGTPTSGSPSLSTLPGLPSAGTSPYAFVFFDLAPSIPGVDTLYIADDSSTPGGGLEKWTLSSVDGGTSAWTQAWVVAAATSDAGAVTGFRGLAGYATGTTVTLMATTAAAAGAQDSLAVIVDTGTGTPTPTIVTTSLSNETFRGVALPPHD
jgi:hypothetical protein